MTLAPEPPFHLMPATKFKNIIAGLPGMKANQPDTVTNQLPEFSKSHLSPILSQSFNLCLKNSFFLPQCRTEIIWQHNNEDYWEAGSYWTIELLKCISKVLEALSTHRIAHWAEANHIIAEGDTGGRQEHSTDDVFGKLRVWIKHKWSWGLIVWDRFLHI